MGLNVRICAFDDRDLIPGAVESVRDVLGGVDIHVCDGRYATFAGEYDLTPGLAEWCADRENVYYHAPPADRLPFGHALDAPPEWRPGNHAKAQWINYEVLPQDEWSLKLDTDERLRAFKTDVDGLDPETRYAPLITLHGETKERANVERLWQPLQWTCWIDDCLLPRAVFPRDTPLERLQRVWRTPAYRQMRFVKIAFCSAIEIDNYGADRPEEYQQRRAAHLRTIGRDDRWADFDDRLSQQQG